MGSISDINVSDSPMETKEENLLRHLNSMRDHDGLEHLKKLPKGIKFIPRDEESTGPSIHARQLVESLLHERKWLMYLDVDINEYDLGEQGFREIRDAVVRKLRSKIDQVDKVLGESAAFDLGQIIHDMEDTADVEDFDSVMSDLYDWADANSVWVGKGSGNTKVYGE